MNKFSVMIGEEDYTDYTVYPIKWSKLLDERLDETRISMKQCNKNIISPLTYATITLKDKNNNTILLRNIVSTDEAVETPVGSGRYNHEMMQLEETKLLEGIVVDALTFTNNLGRHYASYSQPIDVQTKETTSGNPPYPAQCPVTNNATLDTIKNSNQPKGIGSYFTFPSINDIFSNYGAFVVSWQKNLFSPTIPIDQKFHEFPQPYSSHRTLDDTSKTVLLDEEGGYSASYLIDVASSATPISGPIITYELRVDFTFKVVRNREPLPKWTVTAVIERLLDVAEPHFQGIAPRFHLNEEQAKKFSSIDAFEFVDTPEFALPSGTLKEDLDIIGGYIHGIPRLKGSELFFDMLGGTEQATIADPQYPYITNVYTQDIESFCTSLDSTVDNLVSTLDEDQGTVTEPYYDGYKSVRTEMVYARVTEDNMCIETQMPIQEIMSVKVGWIPGKDIRGGEISAYVFEAAEYSRLKSYSAVYTEGKSYALYYTQGTKNIYGLNFKVKDANSSALKNYAIINILESVTGQDIGQIEYALLAFQVTYKPIFSARVQQTKQNIAGFTQPRSLIYNQNANLVETRYYGENLKGTVARMGNVDRIVTYNLSDFSLLPEIGQMFGEDYYIAGVTCEMYPTLIKCMLTLSQNFNRLSQYVGINSVKRFYEVSEKQAYNRHIKYADYVVIGDEVEPDDTLISMIPIIETFAHSSWRPEIHRVSYADIIGLQENPEDNVGTRVALPVVSASMGTAMTFTFAYEDNYSAGSQTVYKSAGGVSGYFTNSVGYSDYYGRLYSLSFSMHNFQSAPASEQIQNGIATKLPEWYGDNLDYYIKTPKPIVIRKNGSEIISVSYVVEFVTNRNNYIIGSALSRNCPLMRGTNADHAAALYVLPKKIAKFAARVPLDGAVIHTDYSSGGIELGSKHAKFSDVIATIDGVAWAIVDKSNGELLIGSNETIKAGQQIHMPYITLKHQIFNL